MLGNWFKDFLEELVASGQYEFAKSMSVTKKTTIVSCQLGLEIELLKSRKFQEWQFLRIVSQPVV